jgi:hypothetical protein
MNISYLVPDSKNWDENHTLSSVLTRYAIPNGKYHVAIHDFIADVETTEYSKLHSHDQEDEINIIFSRKNFQIKLVVNDEESIVTNNCVLIIPAGSKHSANVISGVGIFICIRIPVLTS